MSLNGSLGLGVTLTARDLASGALLVFGNNMQKAHGQAQEAASGISSSLKVIGGGLMLAGAVWAGGLGYLANVSGEFNEQVAATGAVAGASAAELIKLHDAALDAGIATQFSPKQAIVGLGDLAQAGYSAAESIELLRPVLDLAAGSLGKLTPSGAAGLAAQTLKAFQIETKDASITVDKLLQSVNAFALSGEELPLALGTASRGAQAMKQSLDETLITLGLVKNIIPSVERASTAVAVSMERMVNPKTAGQLRSIGVNVADAQGKFRPFLDVLQDMEPALAKMTDQKRAGFLEHAFGAEALGGIQAIMTQVTGGIKTNTGEVVKGAAAIKYLRDQFANAGGTAKNFSDALLNTFEGQKKLVKGSFETLAIVAGEPLEKAFKPIVSAFLGHLNGVLGWLRQLPEPVKVGMARLAIFGSVLLTVVGGLMVGGVAVAALVAKLIAMKAAIVVAAQVLIALLPPLLAIGLAIAALKVAYEKDIGGFGEFVRSAVAQAKVAWDGLVQVFSQGGFSGAVRDELNKAENQGVKEFVISVYTWVGRIKSFFRGVGAGFSEFIGEAKPVVQEFISVVTEAGNTLFNVGQTNDPKATFGKWQTFGEIGRKIGDTLGRIAGFALKVVTALIRIGAAAWVGMGPIVTIVGGLMGDVGSLLSEFEQIGVEMGLLSASSSGAGSTLASVVTRVLAFVSSVLLLVRTVWGVVAWLARGVVNVLGGALEFLVGLFTLNGEKMRNGLLRVFYGLASIVVNIVLGVIRLIAGVIDSTIGLIKPGFSFFSDSVAGWQKDADKTLRNGFQVESSEEKRDRLNNEQVMRDYYAAQRIPSVAAVQGEMEFGGGNPGADAFAAAAESLQSVADRPIQVTAPVTLVMPDGEVLASVVAQGQTANGVREGVPVLASGL